MAEKYITCEKTNLSLEQLFKEMIYEDADGNPALHTDPNGTVLQPWFTCDRQMTFEQTMRKMILVDGDGNPYLNTTA